MIILTRLVLIGLLSAATISATAQHGNGEQQTGADTSGQCRTLDEGNDVAEHDAKM